MTAGAGGKCARAHRPTPTVANVCHTRWSATIAEPISGVWLCATPTDVHTHREFRFSSLEWKLELQYLRHSCNIWLCTVRVPGVYRHNRYCRKTVVCDLPHRNSSHLIARRVWCRNNSYLMSRDGACVWLNPVTSSATVTATSVSVIHVVGRVQFSGR